MSCRWICLASASALLWPVAAFAQAGSAQDLTCSVSGYDISIVNMGEAALEEGIVLIWSVPFARAEKEHALKRPLDPGDSRFLAGALGSSYLEPGTPCEVTRQ